MTFQELQNIQFTNQDLLNEYRTRPLTKNSVFLINGNHYIVGAVDSGKTTLMSKLIIMYKNAIVQMPVMENNKQIATRSARLDPYILYFSNFGANETMALNLNSKGIQIVNITYGEAMVFLSEFDEVKYSAKEVYIYYKFGEQNYDYNSNFIKRMKEKIMENNPIKHDEKPLVYVERIAELFQSTIMETINKYSQPSQILRFKIPALIQNVSFQKKLKVIDDKQTADIKILKIPILNDAQLLNTLMLFDDVGPKADIQRFSSSLAKTITHLVSYSRHSKNTIFFIAQRPQYLFKKARILLHVICLGVHLGESNLKQIYEENSIQGLDYDEFLLLYGTLNKYEFMVLNKWLGKFELLRN